MKKLLTLVMTGVIALGAAGSAAALAANRKAAAEARAASEAVIYLVPGTYVDGEGKTVKNTIPFDATPLTDEECAAISTENAYACEVEEGMALPAAETDREGYTFNGWWGIEDATVTYYETAPAVAETKFLYADFRTALSQRMDPVIPDPDSEERLANYMLVTRAATGKTERIELFVSGTDVANAEKAGYSAPVQFYNEWFSLAPGDVVYVYTTGIFSTTEAILSPQNKGGKRWITLEANAGVNSTSSYLKCQKDNGSTDSDYTAAGSGDPRFLCVAKTERYYRIYIKFYDGGGTMTIYMEPQS